MRVDKWLWVARFYKSRTLAAEAVSGGRVHLNGQRTKPGKEISPGDRLEITRDHLRMEIDVVALSDRRGPATTAQLLYAETLESTKNREETRERQRLERAETSNSQGRPSKRDRRHIVRFKRI